MSPQDMLEWAGAGIVALAAGLVDPRLGIFVVGVWFIWAANMSGGADDGTDAE